MDKSHRPESSSLAPCGVHSRIAAQTGVSLFIVLIALVLMSLAAVGLIRMVDTGNLVIGNLAFKQGTTSVADRAAEAAIAWLQANNSGVMLYTNNTTVGYYASSLSSLDVTGKSVSSARAVADWNGDNCAYAASGSFTSCIKPSAASTTNGYTTRFLITRLCKTTGDPNDTGNGCAKPVSNGIGDPAKRGELKYGEDKRFAGTASPYFRIIVRSAGPRNTVSFTETYVHF